MTDDFDDSNESFGRRKDRRRPKGGRRRRELLSEGDGDSTFADAGLNALAEKGLLISLGEQVRGGKEATVYRAVGPDGPLAAKVYSDPEVRGFQADEVYRTGRYVADRRARKLLGSARRRGLDPELAHWVFHEYQMLWTLHRAGVNVPRPAVGPDPLEMVEAGRVVLMEWIGDEEPAPRLSEAPLTEEDVDTAWQQSLELLSRLLDLGLVHGDLSTYNLLWWEGRIVLIDVPQAVELERNPHAGDLLERDVKSLCSSFRTLGIDQNPDLLLIEVRTRAGYPPSGPLERR